MASLAVLPHFPAAPLEKFADFPAVLLGFAES